MKLVKTGDLRDVLDSYNREEISYSRIAEILNNTANERLKAINYSQQRELLIAFQENFYEGMHGVTRKHIELGVDKYLSNS